MIWIAAISFIVGAVLAYWWVQNQLNQQQQEQLEQSRKLAEELERSHQSRLQQTVESLQVEHQAQLQAREESQRNSETRLQESLDALRSQYESQLQEAQGQLQALQTQMQETAATLRSQYESQLQEAQEQLSTRDSQPETLTPLRSQYESQLQQVTEEFHNREALLEAAVVSLEVQYENQVKELTQELETGETPPPTPATFLEVEAPPVSPLQAPEISAPPQAENLSSSSPVTTATPAPLTLPVPAFNPPPPPVVQDLRNQIAVWGNSGQIYYIPNLIGYANHQESQIRELVASALGKIGAANSLRAELQRAIPILGKLSQDSSPQVRLSAVEALGMIKSEKVIAFLQRALRDTEGAVVQSANVAFGKFKFYSLTSATTAKKDVRKPNR